MTEKLALALSGGGSRGALQIGAMYALLEYGLKPDFVIGASIGAVNATFLALNGFSTATIDKLASAWRLAQASDLMPANYLWLTVRAMFNRSSNDPSRRLRDFFIAQGLAPELSFSGISQPNLVIVSADLNSGQPILHGEHPDDNVLDALLLSTALPPWFMPVRTEERYLVDGGMVSNLPIEPALKLGATAIIALDLNDSRELLGAGEGVRGFFDRLIFAVGKRQIDLELELAEARNVPLLYIGLTGDFPVPIWDFAHTDELIKQGYEIARQVLESQRDSNSILSAG